MTGGAFGPESGLLAVAASVMTLIGYVKLVPARAPAPLQRETTTSSPIAS